MRLQLLKGKLLLLLLLFIGLEAKDIAPAFRLQATGIVTDFVLDGTKLYAATDMGSVDIFDLNSKTIVNQILLEPIKTARGETIPPRIHSVDRLNGKTLIVSNSSQSTFRNVWIHENGRLKIIVDKSKEMFIKKARFIDDGRIMFGTFASEMILYDTAEGYAVYNSHVTQSTLGDIMLSDDRKKMVMSDESGEIRLIDVESSKVEQVLSSENVDNVYRVAYSNGVILSAGQDRRLGVYPIGGEAYHLKSDFLIYATAISPSAETGVYSSGVNSDLQLFNTKTRKKGDRLVGHYALVTNIKFINERELLSAGDEKDIFYWSLD